MSTSNTTLGKRKRLDLSDEVTVVVGVAEKKFTVPKCFLTKTSDFFKKCCSGKWQESSSRTVKLPEVEPETFQTYLQWLYTHEVVAVTDEDDIASEDDSEGHKKTVTTLFPLLVSLAILADQLMDRTFANAIIDQTLLTISKTGFYLHPITVSKVYMSLPVTSKLRSLCSVLYLAKARINYVLEQHTNLPAGLFVDMTILSKRMIMEKIPIPAHSYTHRCEYHEHSDDVPKSARCV